MEVQPSHMHRVCYVRLESMIHAALSTDLETLLLRFISEAENSSF